MSVKMILGLIMGLSALTAFADHSELDDIIKEVREARQELTRANSDLRNIGDNYGQEEVMPSSRDRRYFSLDLRSFEDNYLNGSGSIPSKLEEIEEMLVRFGRNGGGSGNDCRGRPSRTECDQICSYPGKRNCRVIDCNGNITSRVTESCALDQSLFSCGACEFKGLSSGGRAQYGYSIFYNGVEIDVHKGGDTQCNSRKTDRRCQ